MAWVLSKWTLRQKLACRRDRELERQEWVEGVIRETLADLQRCPHTSLSLHGSAPQEEAYREQVRFPPLRAAPADGSSCELMATNICGSGGWSYLERSGQPTWCLLRAPSTAFSRTGCSSLIYVCLSIYQPQEAGNKIPPHPHLFFGRFPIMFNT